MTPIINSCCLQLLDLFFYNFPIVFERWFASFVNSKVVYHWKLQVFKIIFIRSSTSFEFLLSETRLSLVSSRYIERNCAGDIFSIINKCIFSFALRLCACEKYLGRLDLIDWLRERLLIIFDSATDFFQMKYVYSKELPYSWQNNTTLCRGKPFSRENDIADDTLLGESYQYSRAQRYPKCRDFLELI